MGHKNMKKAIKIHFHFKLKGQMDKVIGKKLVSSLATAPALVL